MFLIHIEIFTGYLKIKLPPAILLNTSSPIPVYERLNGALILLPCNLIALIKINPAFRLWANNFKINRSIFRKLRPTYFVFNTLGNKRALWHGAKEIGKGALTLPSTILGGGLLLDDPCCTFGIALPLSLKAGCTSSDFKCGGLSCFTANNKQKTVNYWLNKSKTVKTNACLLFKQQKAG